MKKGTGFTSDRFLTRILRNIWIQLEENHTLTEVVKFEEIGKNVNIRLIIYLEKFYGNKYFINNR